MTFPFDAAAPETQPEVLARVVRSQTLRGTDADREGIAVHFEGLPRAPGLGTKSEAIPEAKNGSSRSVALPIRVRPRHILWHEEAMTIQVSADKIRFLSNREYEPGETLLVTFANDDTKPWHGGRDIPAQIVNVEKLPLGTSLVITLKRLVD